MTEERLKEIEMYWRPGTPAARPEDALELVAEVRRLRAERVTYKAKLVDDRWAIEREAVRRTREQAALAIEAFFGDRIDKAKAAALIRSLNDAADEVEDQ